VAVAALLAGDGSFAFCAPFLYFWSDHYDVNIQLAGRAAPGDEVRIVDGSLAERRFVALYGRGERFSAVLGFNRPRLVMQYRKRLREGASLADALRG